MSYDPRQKIRPMLRRFIEAEGVEIESSHTKCPCCGSIAWLQQDTWRCNRCNLTADVVVFAQKLHPELSESEAIRYVHDVLDLKLHELETVEANDLMDMEFRSTGYLIERLLGKGLYILAGASKIGKSWLVLWLADCVSRGLPVWGLRTVPCEVLYLSLEDTKQRIQQRLDDVTGGETGRLHIATDAELLGSGFEEQLNAYLTEHPGVGFVIIDTLQRIRPMKTEKYSYAGDYGFMTPLKKIADEYNITILLVHHTRKEESSDAFNMISGTTGLFGAADGAWVLRKPDRSSTEGILNVTGRETADVQLSLNYNRQKKRWDLISFGDEDFPESDPVLDAIAALVEENHTWSGTATELLETIQASIDLTILPHVLTRHLNASISRLEQNYGVCYRTSRSSDARIIHLSLVQHDANDANDGISKDDAVAQASQAS